MCASPVAIAPNDRRRSRVKNLCKSARFGTVDVESVAGRKKGPWVLTYELEVRLLTGDERHDGQLYRSLPCPR